MGDRTLMQTTANAIQERTENDKQRDHLRKWTTLLLIHVHPESNNPTAKPKIVQTIFCVARLLGNADQRPFEMTLKCLKFINFAKWH